MSNWNEAPVVAWDDNENETPSTRPTRRRTWPIVMGMVTAVGLGFGAAWMLRAPAEAPAQAVPAVAATPQATHTTTTAKTSLTQISDTDALDAARAFNTVWRKAGTKDARYEALLKVASRRLASELAPVDTVNIPDAAGDPEVKAHVEDQVLVGWPLTKKRLATIAIGHTDEGLRVIALGMDQAGVTPTLPGKTSP